MSDLDTQRSPASSENTSASASDSLQKLHKMSRTAGLGSGGDYAAVNGISVAAVLFGVASALAAFDAVFLLIPALTIILAGVAWYQIRRSAGTQTGRPLCITAVVLALASVAFLGSKQLLAYLEERRNKDEISALAASLGSDLSTQNFDAAYDRFSSEFKERVPKVEFVSKFQQFENYFGRIKSMRWNGRIKFDVDVRQDQQLASTLVVIDLPNDKGTREEMHFRKTADKWLIDDLPFAFPKPVKVVDAPGRPGPAAPR
ncbi:hypothetical protein BH09PLA1_BH09PLA1_17620 [soil metagenome]